MPTYSGKDDSVARILLVGQDKGGVGKSTAVRALAEAVPGAKLIEIDSSHRLLEYDVGVKAPERRRVSYFPMRADRDAIDRTGGKAARAEFDDIISAFERTTDPTIVDVGANTSSSLFTLLAQLAPDLRAAGLQLGVLVVATAEPAAIAEASRLVELARPWAEALFVLENQMRGAIDPKRLNDIAPNGSVSSFAEQAMEAVAVDILQGRGLRDIPNLEPAQLNKTYGLALGARVRRDLTRFRLEAMEAVRAPANWLVG
jgi:hypothetical protein